MSSHDAPVHGDPVPVIAALLSGEIADRTRVAATPGCHLDRVALRDGRVLGVKHYTHGRSYAIEGAVLRELAGVLPVPEIVYTLDRVIAYRWIQGVTLRAAIERDPTTLHRLATSLGTLLGSLSRTARSGGTNEHAMALELLAGGQVHAALGSALADPVRALLAAAALDDRRCLTHGELSCDRVIVTPDLDGIAGVVDWERATAGPHLRDVGRLLREHDDDTACDGIERAHGELTSGWRRTARLHDLAHMVCEVLVALHAANGASTIDARRAQIAAAVDAIT